MRFVLRLASFLIGSFLVLGILAAAQSANSSLHGTVADPKGAVVAGASVTLSNQATSFSRTVKTDDQGSYQFLEVPPSTYVMTVTASGFATTKHENVVLQVSSPTTANITRPLESMATDFTNGAAGVANSRTSMGSAPKAGVAPKP